MNDMVENKPLILPTGERFMPGMALSIHLEHMHRYHLVATLVIGKQVLDIASGEGYGSSILAEVAAHVTGVDVAPEAVEHARQHYQKKNLEYKVGDAAAIPLPDASVDVVVSFETIEHHDKHDEMMREIKRVLRPNGIMVMSSPDKLYYSDLVNYENHYHVKELYEDEFKTLVGRFFKNSQYYYQRLMYGSAIFAVENNATVTSYREEEGGVSAGAPLAMPTYIITVASDGLVPQLASGIYEKPIDTIDYDQWQKLKQECARLRMVESSLAIARLDADMLRGNNDNYAKAVEVLTKTVVDLQANSKKLLDMLADKELKLKKLQHQESVAAEVTNSTYYDAALLDHLNQSFVKTSDTAVVMHLYYEDLIEPIFTKYLDALSQQVDLIVTLQPNITVDAVKNIHQRFPNSYFIATENRGRDIRPFLLALRLASDMGYDFICKIHTKKSPHRLGGDEWRDALIGPMLKSSNSVEALQKLFRSTPQLGLMMPDFSYVSLAEPEIHLGNLKWLQHLLEGLGQKQLIGRFEFNFPAGSMYWARVAALLPLLDEKLIPLDAFEEETGQTDGTLAHGIERIIGLVVAVGGYQAGTINVKTPRPVSFF